MQSNETTANSPVAQNVDVVLEKNNRAGIVTLNRPAAINALKMEMIKAIEAFYVECMEDPHIYGIVLQSSTDGVFSAGGDLRQIFDLLSSSNERAAEFFANEYQHNWTLERFNKPHIPLMNGLVMGGGVGISLYGTHRIAGEKFAFSMPETAIGFFPDVGTANVLAHLPAHIGTYLGLTGHKLNAADAYDLKLITHFISSNHYDEIRAAMIESDPIDPVLEELHTDPGDQNLRPIRPWIIEAFSAPTIEEIMNRLENMPPDAASWGQETAQLLRQRSPLALKVALNHIQRAQQDKTIKQTLIRDFQLARKFFANGELREGIRALIIDKDKSPNWMHKDHAEISDEEVEAFFSSDAGSELSLIDYGVDI